MSAYVCTCPLTGEDGCPEHRVSGDNHNQADPPILHSTATGPGVTIRHEPPPPPWHYRVNADGTIESARWEVSS